MKKPSNKKLSHELTFNGFKEAVRTILATNKQESDEQISAFQASNRKRREAKKKG